MQPILHSKRLYTYRGMTKGLVQKHVSCANLTEGRWLLQEVVETRALIYQESVEEIINPIVHMEFLMFVCMKIS